MEQQYGVLRVVGVRPPAHTSSLQERYQGSLIPEERLVHLVTRTDTAIGRALDNDVVLMDPTVSRFHARLLLDKSGWHIVNLTAHNVVRVNGEPVQAGQSFPVQPQDTLILGSTMLQLIAPQPLPRQTAFDDVSNAATERLPASSLLSSSSLSGTPQRQIPAQSNISVEPGHGVQATLSAPQSPSGYVPGNNGGGSISALPVQPEPELVAQPWDDEDDVNLMGVGVTMQFALPQRMGPRTRWMIAGIAIAILGLSALVTILLNSVIGFSALAEYGPWTVVTALTIPVIPAIGINFLVDFMDRFEREPWFLRLAAFLWGALIAIPPTWFIERQVDGTLQNILPPGASDVIRSALAGLNAGITEETIKGIGLLLLFVILRDEFDNVTDGIVYGALIGAGFAMVENFSYFATQSHNILVFLIVGRIILGWLGHSTFTACFGAGLGYVRHTRVRWKQIVIPLLGYLIAVGLHSFFDFVDFQASAAVQAAPGNVSVATFSLIAIIGDYIPPFLAQIGLLYILIKSLAHEAAVIREFLSSEVSNGVVRVDEYALLQNSFQRTRAERRALFKCGIRQWLRVKALYQTQIGLAFRKWHVQMGDKPKLGYRQPEDAYRQRIARLRKEIRMAELRKGQK
ncbi:MAG TPA: PrsW family glutamic-type intramembrane protease [Ktedonobacteraceae bacterium]|nr:PrsW family glutamic-type intramembrane protease [Ktedonobacteraceae bacterium]